MDGADPRGTQREPDDAAGYVVSSLPGLLALLQQSDVQELELQEGTIRVRLHRAPHVEGEEPVEVDLEPATTPLQDIPLEIMSPAVGTFYRASRPGMPPLVDEGSVVEDDTVVGIIETLHVLTDVEAGCRGTVSRVLATDGQPVEYGQVLFEVSAVGR
ncbi:MAG: acetyl-CoA carboxylase biotin carboxyl carrier protein [Chloroflexi bacterium]|nr:acetyl-CoA carboxylase biotin carboxyl carrier protein [Chloroflexota bacterium]